MLVVRFAEVSKWLGANRWCNVVQSLVLYVLTPVGGAEGAARELRGSPLAETPGNETN